MGDKSYLVKLHLSYIIRLSSTIVCMVIYMYTIKNLSEILGWSSRQIYDRIKAIDGFIAEYTERGKKNKILVDQGGFMILRRLSDLENDDYSIKEGVKIVVEEVLNPESEGRLENNSNQYYEEVISNYERQLEHLQRQIQEKDKLINWFQEQIKEGPWSKVKRDTNDTHSKTLIEYPG